VEQAEISRIERIINRELRERFGLGAVQRAVLLQHGEEQAIEPGHLMVRVFIPAPSEPGEYEQALAAGQAAHQPGMETLRRELSLRLPSARLLEFTFDDPGAATPRILMPDDGALADRAAGQLRHPAGRAPGRQHRLPRRPPGTGPGVRGTGPPPILDEAHDALDQLPASQ
jgi:hypothetical protein